ncbi:hypothetical protein J4O75_22895 [Paenibacillus pabuli]
MPYQYLYSKNWSFFYHSLDNISLFSKEDNTDPKESMLSEIYGVDINFPEHKCLLELFEKECGFIVTKADGWYLPWAMNYKREHGDHWFSIVDYCSKTSRVKVIDKIPEHDGWEDFHLINEGFLHGGSVCFKLENFNFNLTEEKLVYLLRASYQSILGTSQKEGVNGLKVWKKDIIKCGKESGDYVKIWWDSLKDIIDYRNQFVEYISFLSRSKDSIIIHQAQLEPLYNAFTKTVNKWISFRHGLMKSFINGTFNYEKTIERLDNIIIFEEKCASELQIILELWGEK